MASSKEKELGPIFRAYGAACYSAQNLESTLRFLLVLYAAHEKKRFTPDVIRLVESETATSTLRDLFEKARQREYFTDIEARVVLNAIKQRNLLIHNYWDKQVFLLANKKGRGQVKDDLYRIRDYLVKANAIVISLNDHYLKQYSIGAESLNTEGLKKRADEAWQNDNDEPPEVSE